ncbi:hypothetical protein Tco_0488767, partial [Tanacetum coccineum]
MNLPNHRITKMEMQIPHYSKFKFMAHCSYSRNAMNLYSSRKNDPKLLQTLISTSSVVCQKGVVSQGDGAIYLRFPNKGYCEKIRDHATGYIVVG